MKPAKNFPHFQPGFPGSIDRNGLTSSFFRVMVAVAILAFYGTPARAALSNYLTNSGFESGLTGWTIVPPWTWNGASYAVQNTNQLVNGSPTAHVSVHGGTNAFKEWGYYQAYATTPGAMQTFAASPGSEWSADGWVSTQVPDNISTNGAGTSSRSFLQVLFLDATTNYNAALASYTSEDLDNTSATNTWLYRQVTDGYGGTNLVAPLGTAFVRFQMILAQPGPSGGVYAGGSAYWDDVRLFNTSKPDPEITVQPLPVTQVYGETATFSVVADGLSALSYKWQKDGADITDPNAYGVTTSTLTLSNVTTAMMGDYTVTVTDSAGALTSEPAFLTVQDPGIISITPTLGQTKNEGQSATFTVLAAGSVTPTYAWQKDGTPLSNGGRISGATGPSLTVANLTAADSGSYTVLVDSGVVQTNSGLKVANPAEQATNLLNNAGFEDGALSLPWEMAWTRFNGVALVTTNDFYYLSDTPVSVYSGNYVSDVYGSDADNGLYQNVPVAAGATYHAGGWFYMSHFSPLGATVTVTLQLMFKDAGGNTIATFTAPAVNSSFASDTWTFLQVTNAAGSADLVAPAGAVSATCQIYQFNWSFGGGTVYFDNLFLTQASLPAPSPVTISASALGGMMNLSFPTTSGVSYEVIYSDSLSGGSTWQTNTTIVGDGTVKGISDLIGPTQRFYRLLEHY